MIIKDLRKMKSPSEMKVECKCGSAEYTEKKEIFKNGTIHIRATCVHCGKFIKWLPHSQSEIMKEI